MKTIKDLEGVGFVKTGNWFLTNNESIDFNLQDEYIKEILYAFVLNEIEQEIIYIGKTIKTLKDRMNGYRKPGLSQNTNIRLNKIIKDLLNQQKEVFIYVFKNSEDLMFKGFKINLSAGLEDELIKKFTPKHNLHGNSRILEDVETNENNIIITTKSQDNDCFTGFKAASNSNLAGIINLSFIPQEFLPEFGSTVNVYLDNLTFESIFRNGNNNGQYDPRINSTLIGNWLTDRINVNENFYVKVCKKNKFYFYVTPQ
jgi:hypothetical protein